MSQFRTNRELKALNLTEEFGKHWMPEFSAKEARFLPVDSVGKAKSVWTEIDNAFSRPVGREDESTEYVPTQILAELFRGAGYEAIAYRSLLGKQGFNVVLFDPGDADPVDGRPYEVTKVDVVGEQAGNPWVRRSVKSRGAGRDGDG